MIETITALTLFEWILIGGGFVFLCFMIFVSVLLFKLRDKKHTADALVKIVDDQKKRMTDLERQINKHESINQIVAVRWAPPREDKSAYRLIVYNDTPDTIFNLKMSIESDYRPYSKIYLQEDEVNKNKTTSAFFIPGGWMNPTELKEKRTSTADFADIWLQNRLQPIQFVISWTSGIDATENIHILKIDFTRKNLTSHLKESIRAAKRLRIVATPTNIK